MRLRIALKRQQRWLDARAEFEALAPISVYAREHPDDAFPELQQGPSSFAARALGHPLIPDRNRVRNVIQLDAEERFYIVSGSNMARKITLLRSIGLPVLLANATRRSRRFQVHMGSRSGEDSMDFDSLLKPGITTETNALAMAGMMGVPIVNCPR